jgi:hypothetical protein
MKIPEVLELIEELTGRGRLVDKRTEDPDPIFDDECPFCGSFWHVAYLDNEWTGNQSSPDDVFECPGCGATCTRRDSFGPRADGDEWDKDIAIDRKGLLS